MKQKFALTGSICVAMLIMMLALAFTTQATQAAAPAAPTAGTPIFINEIHYDNTGADSGEGVEVAGPAGADLTNWRLVPYNGNDGAAYAPTITLTGVLSDQQNGFGTAFFTITGLQNGAPDGVALLNAAGTVVQFLSYEGVFTATSGPAQGLASTDIGVLENGTNAVGTSLQLRGTGSVYEDFTWTSPASSTYAAINISQTFALPPIEADLGLSKDGPATALASDVFTYAISLSNTGNYTATGTIITDTLPTEVTFITYTTALPVTNFTQNGQDLIWDLGDVPTTTANAIISVRVAVSPTVLNGTSFTNTVAGTTTYTETNLANNGDFVTTFIGAPDLAIVKSGPASVDAGDTFTYTLTYSNAGTINATGVEIVDQLPAGVTFVTETTASAVVANGQITWTVGALNVGAGSSIEVAVTAINAGDWVNTATISGGPVDSNLLNNTASVTTTINGVDVYVSKTGPAVAFGGELISYTITYGNSGNLTATATLTDQLPISFTLADVAVDNSGLPFANGVWTASIAPNTEMSFTFALTVPTTISNSTRITNSLSISTLEAGDDPADNAASASSTVYQIVPIATARAGAVGTIFGVEGSVTYVPGTYNSSGWALQDASGGIAVFYNPPPSVQLGDRVRLVATRGVNAAEAQLASTVYYFANLGSGPQVTPRPYTTAQIASGTTEGWLAIITGTVSSVPATCTGNQQFNIDDGSGVTVIFVDVDTTINVCNLGIANGDRVMFTGFSTQFNGTFEIKPRFPADVKRLFDVTFVYNDLEDVVHVGEDVQLRGDFNGWVGDHHDARCRLHRVQRQRHFAHHRDAKLQVLCVSVRG